MDKTLSSAPTADASIDASGLNCPMPILRTKKALAKMQSGQVLSVKTTDQHAKDDFQAFCQQTGNTLLYQADFNDEFMLHYLRRR